MSTYDGLWPLCETCGAVPTSHRDYRDCEAHMQVVAQAYDAGREKERAAVVAWLREEAEASAQTYTVHAGEWAGRADCLANCIERGEHRTEVTE